MVLGCFGPYLFGGIRTEQVVIYFSLYLILPQLPRIRLVGPGLAVIVIWFALIGIGLLGVIWPPATLETYGNALAGIDNLVLPLAAMLLAAYWAQGAEAYRRQKIDTIASVVVLSLIANSAFALVATVADVTAIGRHFWVSNPGSALTSVAQRAASAGRFGGVFNQPAEAGLAYSLGLQLALWRWAWREDRPARLALVIAGLSVGGLLCVSKVFVYAGVPAVGMQLWVRSARGRGRRFTALLVAALLGAGSLVSGIIPWEGRTRMLGLFSRQGTPLINQLTADRLGDNSSLLDLSDKVLSGSPWVGYGAQGINIPTDSAWVGTLVAAGLIGLGLYALLLLVIARSWVTGVRWQQRPERRLSLGVIIVTFGASFGLPSTTAERGGVLIWLILGMTLLFVPTESPNDSRRPLPRTTRSALGALNGASGGLLGEEKTFRWS